MCCVYLHYQLYLETLKPINDMTLKTINDMTLKPINDITLKPSGEVNNG